MSPWGPCTAIPGPHSATIGSCRLRFRLWAGNSAALGLLGLPCLRQRAGPTRPWRTGAAEELLGPAHAATHGPHQARGHPERPAAHPGPHQWHRWELMASPYGPSPCVLSMDASWKPPTAPQDLRLCPHPWMNHGNPIQHPRIFTCVPIHGCIMETPYKPQRSPLASPSVDASWKHHTAPPGPPTCVSTHGCIPMDHQVGYSHAKEVVPTLPIYGCHGWGSSCGPLSTVLPPVSPLVSPSMVTSQELHTTPGPPIHGCILGTPYNQPVQVLHLCPNSWIPRNGPPPWPCQRVCLNAPYIGLPWMGEPSKPPSTVLSHFSEQPLSHRSLGLGEQRWLQ